LWEHADNKLITVLVFFLTLHCVEKPH